MSDTPLLQSIVEAAARQSGAKLPWQQSAVAAPVAPAVPDQSTQLAARTSPVGQQSGPGTALTAGLGAGGQFNQQRKQLIGG